MQWLTDKIGNPETAHDVHSPEEYRAKAQRVLAPQGRSLRRWGGDQPEAFVSSGRWVCMCACGNAPSAHPEWGIAVCLECGMEWSPSFPTNWPTFEGVLLAREKPGERHWFAREEADRRSTERVQSVLDLARENRSHGRPATRRVTE